MEFLQNPDNTLPCSWTLVILHLAAIYLVEKFQDRNGFSINGFFRGRHSSLLFSVCSVLVLLFKFFFFSSFEASETSSEFRRTFILATRNLAPFATMLQMCKNVCSLQQEISHLHYLRISFALSPLYSSCILQPSIRLIWRICRIHFGGNQGGSSYDSIEMELKSLLIRIIIIRN